MNESTPPPDEQDNQMEMDRDSADNECSDSEKQQKSKKPKKEAVRKYKIEYLSFGFTFTTDSDGVPKPMCVICSEIFANSSMKPAHLKRHQERKHEKTMTKPLEFFEAKKRDLSAQSTSIAKYTRSDLAAIESSFHIAQEIAKTKKPYSIGEQLIQPCMLRATELMLGPSAANKMKMISLSRRTVTRRVNEMARDIESKLSLQLKKVVVSHCSLTRARIL